MQLDPVVNEADLRTMEAMAQLQSRTPKNEFGFPVGLYRPDLLPLHDWLPDVAVSDILSADPSGPTGDGIPHADDPHETIPHAETAADFLAPTAISVRDPDRVAGFLQDSLDAAYIEIQYDEGFPALADGTPLWNQLTYEPVDAYVCFQSYLQMPDVCEGVRLMVDLPELMVKNELLDVNGHSYIDFIPKFRIYHQLYNWAIRAKAYDLFRVASHRKQTELRSLTMQDDHYTTSSRLLTRLMKFMEDEDDFWGQMTPKVAIDMYKTMTAAQRLSLGLPANAPLTEANGHNQTQPFEVILKTLAQDGISQDAFVEDGSDELQRKLLESPENLRLAQELIVRIGHGQKIE